MSEFQYYEFVAVDRSLSREEMADLRSISSRAKITPTRFTNVYSYGDFRGDVMALMERYYDAHVYVANWGTHTLMFSVPRAAVDSEELKPYRVEGGFAMEVRGERTILTLAASDDSGESSGWVDEAEAEGWMGSLVSLRGDIMNGDVRALYLAWLRGVQMSGVPGADDEDDEVDYGEDFPSRDTVEPPVPPGLRKLSASLNSLIEFLELDADLVAVAAERSETLHRIEPSLKDLDAWAGRLPNDERITSLSRLLHGDNQHRMELLRRFRAETAPPGKASKEASRRTVGELVDAAKAHSVERKRKEAEAAKKERVRRAEEEAKALEERLKSLAGHERAAWQQIETLIDTKQQGEYDQAVALLKDLSALARREDKSSAFTIRLSDLRARHPHKSSLLRKLKEAGLSS